ncbi:MAG: response regulator transcription factor [Bacilli bacterium]|nr:response regulator transcription factor [Bacilli bacterium]
MDKILIVDDEQNIRELIKKYAQFENYIVDEATNGLEAIQKAKENHYDLIIMDVMMPELDGFSAIKEIKKEFDIPAIVLSARGEEYDKLHGFDLGIDDYVVKPFSPKELIMRVNAVLHRYRSTISEKENTNIWRYGDLVIDDNARIVKINNERIDMTPKEYNLLMYLINNENKAVTREQILSQIWGYDFFGDDRTLDTHMKLLRKKLGDYGQCIVTLRGIGYRFEKTKL